MQKMNLYNKINEFINKNIIITMICILLIFVFKGAMQNYKIQTNEIKQYKTTNNIQARSLASTDMVALTYNSADRKIVKIFNLNIVVKNIDKSTQELEELLKKYNGYVENFYSYEYEYSKANNFTIKVPTDNVSQFMKDIKKDGYIKSESFSATDFTEQYTDNANQLKNLYVRRDKLRSMIENDATKIKDIIAIDKELNNVQNEIERLEKSNLKIQNKVDYSQINLTMEPEITENKTISKWSIKKVIMDAVNTLILACQMIIHYFITFIVFLPLFLGFFIVSICIKKLYYNDFICYVFPIFKQFGNKI